MEKSWYQSKTLWGVLVVAITALGQVFGVVADQSTVAEVAKILGGTLGAYGLRDALK